MVRFREPLPRVARLIERRRLPWADMFRPCRAAGDWRFAPFLTKGGAKNQRW
ncbi:MAG: hypothetical protein LBP75_11300 [Planctomycetota bacterium]|nr:hypothetical protein [Planctomycetota bacterium]